MSVCQTRVSPEHQSGISIDRAARGADDETDTSNGVLKHERQGTCLRSKFGPTVTVTVTINLDQTQATNTSSQGTLSREEHYM